MHVWSSLVSWIRRRLLQDRRERWNHQYRTGRWEKLNDSLENARFEAVETFLRQHALAGRVLEIGCGEALLQRHLSEQAYAEWIGIDISDVAISRAQAFSGERIRYLVSDMEIFEPTGLFDAIIFTESIYYIPNRGRQLMRYARFLQPRGVLIVSVFENNQSPAVWEELHAVAKMIGHATTTNELGMWKCEVLVPREAGR